MKDRASWDEYFMGIARQVASRSTCDRKFVGAVIVRDRMILSTGYNGSIRGFPHCSEIGHFMENGHCVATLHAEANAIIQAARNGVNISNSTMYVTSSPCWSCFKMIVNAGITRLFFLDPYPDARVSEHAKKAGLEMTQIRLSDRSEGSQARD